MNDIRRADIVGVNWGSSNLRAYRIGPDGEVRDRLESPAGIVGLDRVGMAACMVEVSARWPDVSAVYACGMVGSNVGWIDAGYVDCPAGAGEVATRMVVTRIGPLDVAIAPGLACQRGGDSGPDVMRGEETELFGLITRGDEAPLVALPGTHTKWARIERGRVVEFVTSMSGEIFDRLTAQGLLASIVEAPAEDSPTFREAVRLAHSGTLGLGTLLFGARARVMCGVLDRADAASWLRGLLIGAELADVCTLYPEIEVTAVPLVGADAPCALYAAALDALGLGSQIKPSRDAVAAGFAVLHTNRTGLAERAA